MLVLTIKTDGIVKLGDNIEVMVVKINDGSVRLGFTAPKEIGIVRAELLDCDGKPKQFVRKGAE